MTELTLLTLICPPELDERLRALQDTLSAGWWVRALQESHGLAGGWRQLARRVSVDGPPVLQHFGQLDALEPPQMLPAPRVPILDKSGFQSLETRDPHAGLVVRSGGSSGKVAFIE